MQHTCMSYKLACTLSLKSQVIPFKSYVDIYENVYIGFGLVRPFVNVIFLYNLLMTDPSKWIVNERWMSIGNGVLQFCRMNDY